MPTSPGLRRYARGEAAALGSSREILFGSGVHQVSTYAARLKVFWHYPHVILACPVHSRVRPVPITSYHQKSSRVPLLPMHSSLAQHDWVKCTTRDAAAVRCLTASRTASTEAPWSCNSPHRVGPQWRSAETLRCPAIYIIASQT